MLVAEKPPLDEDLLLHYGIPGMKWGHRKARETTGPRRRAAATTTGSSGSGRAAAPQKKGWSTKKKVVVAGAGVGIAVGAAATAYILMKRGGVKTGAVSKIAAKVEARAVSAKAPAVKSPWMPTSYHANYPAVGDPTPQQMRLAAGISAHRNAMRRVGSQQLTDKAWRESANFARINKINADLNKDTMANLDWIRQKLADPNHVWKL